MNTTTQPTGTQSTDPRIERTRRVVVAAAAELAAEGGFARTTIDAVAERSGVARSTIYRHWPDRADLFAEAFDVVCSVPDAPDLGSLCADLRLKARHLAHGLSHETWGRILPSLVGAADHDDDLGRALRTFTSQRRAESLELVHRAVARGEIDGDPGVDLAGALERFVAPLFFRRLMTDLPIDDALVERQLRAICADLGAPYAEPEGAEADPAPH